LTKVVEPKAPVSPTVETEQSSGTMPPEALYQLIADRMTWKDSKPAHSWMVNKCRIEEARIKSEPEAVWLEVKALMGWE